MRSLYITSTERYSGKTATCLVLGTHLQADGFRVGYLKPLSLQPWRVGGRIADEDAAFVKEVLGLAPEPWELSPVVVTTDFLRRHLADPHKADLMQTIKDAYQALGADQDVLLLEGGGRLREGYAVGLPTPSVAQALGSQVLVIVKHRDDMQMMDDVLAARTRLGEALCGVLINRVPAEAFSFVKDIAIPYIEKSGLPVFGMLPEERGLSAITVGELIDLLEAEVLTQYQRREALVETLTVGAMTADAALSRFRRYPNKAVITGGDRTDIQLAALETSTTCLILTGNLRPSPLVVKQAEEFGVTTILVRTNTMETIEAIEGILGKTRLGQTAKFTRFQALLEENFDFDRLYRILGLK